MDSTQFCWIDCNVTPAAILEFWFGQPGSPEYGKNRAVWFKKDPSFDAEIRRQFLEVHVHACAGRLADWHHGTESRLALILVLDQFSRNMFRGQPASFTSDAEALRLARQLVTQGLDATLLPVMRSFVYLPFEHSESLADQDEAVRLFALLAQEPGMEALLGWAEKHREVIRRFGRFPHRNAMLGRESTALELVFLAQPGSSF